LRTCQVDSNGCKNLGSPSPCPNGFCADDSTCGSCAVSCPGASCLYQTGSCAEVLYTDTSTISALAHTDDGLFWDRPDLLQTYHFVELAQGQSTPVVLSSTGNYANPFTVLANDNTVFAYSPDSAADSYLLVKPAGQPLNTITVQGNYGLVFATSTTAF